MLILFWLLSGSPVSLALDDSVLQRLKTKSISEQFETIENLPFDFITENSFMIVPVLLEYEKLAVKNNQPETLANICCNLSLAYYYNGKYDENMKYGLKAVHLFDSLGNKVKLGMMYGELGYQMKRRDLSGAFALMQHGITILENVGEPKSLAKIYDNYGVLHEMNNSFDSALFFYRKSFSIKKTMSDSLSIPYSLNNFFSLYMLMGNRDSAIVYLDQSTSIRLYNNDAIGLAENYSYYGDYYSLLGDHQKAKEWELKALKIALDHNYKLLVQSLYQNLSGTYEELGEYNQALYYQKLFKLLNDSLVNLETNKTIASLQVQFDTAEKEKELLARKQELARQKTIECFIAVLSTVVLVVISILYINKMQISRRNEKINVRNALINGEQTERNRLALELHDGVANDLNAVIISLSNLGETDKSINKSVEKLRQTHQNVRHLSHSLMPRSLKENGLPAAFDELRINLENDGLQIYVQVIGLEHRIDPFIEFNVYRITQETLNNIMKHSMAHQVLLSCSRIDKMLMLDIEDDGIGFLPDDVKNQGIGLKNVDNRVKMMNGVLHIKAAPDKGTAINIEIPLVS
jgi:signal transduction histidine kinase